MNLEEFISQSNSASSKEEVFALFQRVLRYLGYDSVVYSLLTDHPSIGRKAGHGVTGNYPKDWMDYYMEKGYFTQDPVPKYAFTTSAAYTWEHVVETCAISKKQKTLMNEAQDAKLYSGAAVAIYGPNFEVAGVGIASSYNKLRPSKDTLAIIRAVSHQFHFAYSQFDLPNGQPERQVSLSPREREVLSYSAEAKSVPVIGIIMGISRGTVKFHLQNIYRKLDVCTKQQAIVKAIRLGLIAPNIVRALVPLAT
ncbi:MAG: autoinducer binding domain-containing protein [Bryobacteraceae bacterium]